MLLDVVRSRLASRIWSPAADAAVFLDRAHSQPEQWAAADASVRSRLGWLRAPAEMPVRVAEIDAVAEAIKADGLTEFYLLGMGGSSLSAEVVRDIVPRLGGARLDVLDTTDEAAIARATASFNPARSCLIVASKSGTTIEVAALERHFLSVLARTVPSPGRHVVAVTDPGTALAGSARERGYRHVFINPPDIGGRYSALSLFGLVPARFVGIPASALLSSAADMAGRCRPDAGENPGLALGAFMGGHAVAGRHLLTIVTSPALRSLGAWIEQLVAESTGKSGRGILPVVEEPVGAPDVYRADRAFVLVSEGADPAMDALRTALEGHGHPVFAIATSREAVGAEFFRWEFATAVAGAVLGVNPFDEPDVRKAKVFTQAQLDARESTGAFVADPPLVPAGGRLRRASGRMADHRARYVAVLDYLPRADRQPEVTSTLRGTIRQALGVPATYGVGPRYLHSTGQYHKGGPNDGLFLVVTAEDATETAVPGERYSFSALKRAQAFGDFDALREAGRAVVHYHLPAVPADPDAALADVVEDFLRP